MTGLKYFLLCIILCPGFLASIVLAQTLDNTIIPDFQVNENAGDASQSTPVVTIDGRGCIVFAWRDNRSGEPDIYAQCFTSDLQRKGPEIRVNDDTGNAWQFSPAIASDIDGNFIITWGDWRTGTGEYKNYAQLYSSDGIKMRGMVI